MLADGGIEAKVKLGVALQGNTLVYQCMIENGEAELPDNVEEC